MATPTPNGVGARPATPRRQLRSALLIPDASQNEAWKIIPSTSELNINIVKHSIRLSFARAKDRSVWTFYGAGLDMADSTLYHIGINFPSKGLSVSHRPLKEHETNAFKDVLLDDAAKFRIVQIKLDEGHNTTVTGFGLPFHGVTDSVDSWVNRDSLIYGAASLTDILQQRDFTVLIKATDAEIFSFIQAVKLQPRPVDYGHGNVHNWDMQRYGEQVPRNRGHGFPPTVYFDNANARDTALTQTHVQDVWDFDNVLTYIAETQKIGDQPIETTEQFVCLLEPKDQFKPKHWRAAHRALRGDFNKLKVTFRGRDTTDHQPVTWEAVHLTFGSSEHLRGVNVKNRIPLGLIRPAEDKPDHAFSPVAHSHYQGVKKELDRDSVQFHCPANLHCEELRVEAINRLSSPEVWPSLMQGDTASVHRKQAFNELLVGKGLWNMFSQGSKIDFPPFDLLHDVPTEIRNACLNLVFEADRERVQQYFAKLHFGFGLVSGPPGTGKSHLASIIVVLMCYNRTIEHVYVSAASNGATDNILDRIHDIARATTSKLIDNGIGIKHLMLVRGYSFREELEKCTKALAGDVFEEDTLWNPSPWRFERSLCWWTLRALGSPLVPLPTSDDNAQFWEFHQSLNALVTSTPTPLSSVSEFKRLVELSQGFCTFAEYMIGKTEPAHEAIVSKLMSIVINFSNVVATTPAVSSTKHYKSFNSTKARAVVFDEAATLFCSDGLLVFGNTPRPMIAIGDPCQLAPVLPTAIELLHGGRTKRDNDDRYSRRNNRRSLEAKFPTNRFAKFGEISWLTWFIQLGHPVFHLYTQHRMAKGLFDLSLKTVYKHLDPHFKYSTLCDPANFPIGIQVENYLTTSHRIPSSTIGEFQPVFFDCRECPCRNYPDSASRLNPRQADCIAKFLVEMIQKLSLSPADIAVLTPYRASLRAVGKRFRKEDDLKDVVCSTFDGFQGREAQIIVLALCVTQETGPSFVANPRSLNVALTRQRSSLLIFGDIDTTAARYGRRYRSYPEDDAWEKVNPSMIRKVLGTIRESRRIVTLHGDKSVDPDSYWRRLEKSSEFL
ncbi:hypothetical protein NW762_011186 [Fusarium torreyae]|uniref:DNA2/NAM7 helicase-like C-terminal domain-containing protein n=1 Tax=Fusarium torreyae TaxID=1237075 RepID=A0A9W8RPY8_9HYPO|nr:hypothetical protein NW762_011186 [Fusarium torreyae]